MVIVCVAGGRVGMVAGGGGVAQGGSIFFFWFLCGDVFVDE